MYKVYCDRWQLHNMTMPALKLVNPKVELEVNKAGSFDFTIYPQHPYYDMLNRLKSIVTVYQNDRLIFRGRILNTELGMYNQKKVTCEGELAFLVDSTIRPYSFQGDVPDLFEYLITEHNKQVGTEKQFKVGQVTVTDPNGYITRADSTYPTTYDCIMNKLVNSLGGYLQFRHETDGVYIDYLADFTVLNQQDIELKKNILDLTDSTKGEGIATAIIPLGAKIAEEGVDTESQKRLTIESVNEGKDYVYDQEAVDRYGWIFKVVTWNDVTVASNLLRKANEQLGQSVLLENTVEVNAVDLSGTDKTISSFSVGAYNNVVSPLHDLNRRMLVKKMTLNLTAPQNDKLTLGDTRKTLTEQDKDNSSAADEKLDDILGKVESIKEVHQGTEPPEDITDIWLDTSLTPPTFKRWNGEQWVIVNDMSDEIINLREELKAEISKTSEGIRAEVSENYYTKVEAEGLVSSVSTELEQTKNEFAFNFNQFRQDLDSLENGTNAEFEQISRYIRFVDGNIILGEAGNELTLKIQHDRISFLQSNAEVAYFSNRKLYVTDGEYTNSLTLGNLGFVPNENGSTSFMKVR